MRSVSSPSGQTASSPATRSGFIEAARKAQIIECAIATIAELGFGRASLTEIARRANVSKSAVLYYFQGKDELIRQTVAAIYAAGAEFMLPRIQEAATPGAQLRAYITANVAFMSRHRDHLRAMLEIVWGFRDANGNSKLETRGLDEVQSDLEQLLRHGQEEGEFRPFSPDVMAFTIRSVIDTIPPLLSVRPDLDLERYAAELADLFDRATSAGRDKKGRDGSA